MRSSLQGAGVPHYAWNKGTDAWTLLVRLAGKTDYLILGTDPKFVHENQGIDDIDLALVYTCEQAIERSSLVENAEAVPYSVAVSLMGLQQTCWAERVERQRAEEFIRDAALPLDHDSDVMVKLEVVAEEAPYFTLPDGYVVIKQSRYDALQAGFEP